MVDPTVISLSSDLSPPLGYAQPLPEQLLFLMQIALSPAPDLR